MDMPDAGHTMDNINKRALAVFIVVVLAVLGTAVWGGTLLEKSQAATQNQELSTNLTSAQQQLSQLQSVSAGLQDNNTALQANLLSAQQQLSQLQSVSAGLQDNNTALQANLTSAQAQLAQLQSQYRSLQDSNTALQANLTSAQAQLAQLQSQYRSLQEGNTALLTQLASAQQSNSALQTQLTSAQQSATALQAQLTAWYSWSRSAPPSPNITLSTASGPSGTSITVAGSGFTASTSGNVVFDINRNGAADPGEPSQNVTTSSTGAFSTTLVVLSLPPGTYPVLASCPAGATAQASASFAVTTGAGS